jgi:PAS domain S-box-containing protein
MVFRTDDPHFTLVDTNRLHSRMAMVKRDEVIGKPFFEVFPDTSPKFVETGISDLRESMRTVIRTGKPDTMEDFRYDIRQPDGAFVERWWRPTHYPLKDAKGKLSFIVQVSHDVTEELRNEQHLREVQQQLEEALAIGQVGSWIWNIPENLVIADIMLSKLFGVTAEEGAAGLPLQTFTSTIHPDDRPRIEAAIHQAVANTSLFNEEYRTTLPDGTVRWVMARGQVEADKSGQATRFPGVIVDITDRKEAEEKFRQQVALTNTITASVGEGLYALNAQGKLVYMNKAASALLGWTFEELEGKSVHDIIHYKHLDGSHRPIEQCKLLSVLKTGETVRDEDDVFVRKDGTIIETSSISAPIIRDGVITGAVNSFNDITDRKRAARRIAFLSEASKALSSSLDFTTTFQRVTELCVPGVADWCSIDILSVERGLEQVAIGHVDPKQIKWAKKLRDKYPTDLDAPTGVPKVLRTGKPEFYPEVPDAVLEMAVDKEQLDLLKRLQIISVMIVPLIIEEESVGAITFVNTGDSKHFTISDLEMAEELAIRVSIAVANADLYHTAQEEIKRREQLEAELREANEKLETRVEHRTRQLQTSNKNLERSNRELEDFAYVASHDLQEPLRKIQAFGNLLEAEYGKEIGEGQDYLNRMRGAAGRMSILIEDLLSFSRVTTKARPFTPIDLQTIASEVVEDLEARIRETKGSVVIEQLPTLNADPLQMRQLFQNLIANALKFHRPDVPPLVEVSAEPVTGKNGTIKAYRLLISDNGIGFDEKYLDRIFAVFQRLHGHDAYEGTGIGLAVCRKIVERHGGSITAESREGQGATFIITLPANTLKEVQL